ncbi:MAG TPA: diacylglycerol kinase family protein [Candidatus Saccharimonadales bacterium]|nr:diacylglycerol kinase family protein [Candidatus Saccharimonadales bacterium]
MEVDKKKGNLLIHQVRSINWAIDGLNFSFNKGTHFKIQTVAAIIVIVLGFIYKISSFEWLTLILISAAVLSTEAMNTALEEACNLLHPDLHPSARVAKHCAAASVLIFSLAAIAIALVIFVPKI